MGRICISEKNLCQLSFKTYRDLIKAFACVVTYLLCKVEKLNSKIGRFHNIFSILYYCTVSVIYDPVQKRHFLYWHKNFTTQKDKFYFEINVQLDLPCKHTNGNQ